MNPYSRLQYWKTVEIYDLSGTAWLGLMREFDSLNVLTGLHKVVYCGKTYRATKTHQSWADFEILLD